MRAGPRGEVPALALRVEGIVREERVVPVEGHGGWIDGEVDRRAQAGGNESKGPGCAT